MTGEIERIAAEVERLEGASREMDAAIKALVGHAWDYAADWGSRGNDTPVAFAYTASLDAAMTLCPQPPSFDLDHEHATQGGKWNALVGEDNEWVPAGRAKAATPALALCAAALKARAYLEQHRHD